MRIEEVDRICCSTFLWNNCRWIHIKILNHLGWGGSVFLWNGILLSTPSHRQCQSCIPIGILHLSPLFFRFFLSFFYFFRCIFSFLHIILSFLSFFFYFLSITLFLFSFLLLFLSFFPPFLHFFVFLFFFFFPLTFCISSSFLPFFSISSSLPTMMGCEVPTPSKSRFQQ